MNKQICCRLSPLGGKGVFAQQEIAKGAVIDECPVLIFTSEEVLQLNQTLLSSYMFFWNEGYCLPFGCGPLINHSEEPNAYIVEHYEKGTISFIAARNIQTGEEIFHDYSATGRPIVFADGHWFFADTMNRE